MIAAIRGILLSTAVDTVIVETGGVALLIHTPRTTARALSAVGEEVRLLTSLQVREDSLTLYGFIDQPQRELFDVLIGVTGIGPKVALSLLSSGDTDEVRGAIAAGDITRLARTPGIGKRTAERLVLELKGKVGPAGAAAAPTSAADTDLVMLLGSLGFSAAEANAALAALPAGAPDDIEERLRLALRYFGGA